MLTTTVPILSALELIKSNVLIYCAIASVNVYQTDLQRYKTP